MPSQDPAPGRIVLRDLTRRLSLRGTYEFEAVVGAPGRRVVARSGRVRTRRHAAAELGADLGGDERLRAGLVALEVQLVNAGWELVPHPDSPFPAFRRRRGAASADRSPREGG